MTLDINYTTTNPRKVDQLFESKIDSFLHLNLDRSQPTTAIGTFTGNGTTQSIQLGFRPDFVVIKGLVAQQAIIWYNGSWYDRSDTLISADSTGNAIQPSDSGFSVGTAAEANTNAVTYYYFAYKDNNSNSFKSGSWHGNAQAGRVVELFEQLPIQAAFIKRDSTQIGQWAFANKDNSYSSTGASNSDVAILPDGLLQLSEASTVNQWSNNLGEGCNGLVFCGNYTYAGTYTGTGAIQRIPLPFECDFLLIQPLANIGQNAHLWFSNLAADQVLAAAPSATILTARLTSVDATGFTLPATVQLNTAATDYGFIAFKKSRTLPSINQPPSPVNKAAIQVNTGGYIDCGISNSLKFDGAFTLEWFGAIYPPSTTPLAGGVGVNNEVNKQIPLIFRSAGADGVAGNCSFGLAAICPRPEGIGQRGGDWSGVSLTWATNNVWELPQTSSPVLDNFPAFSGVVLNSSRLYHILLTHDGVGGYELMVNGVLIKERKRDLVAANGRSNIEGGNNHRTVIGGRQRASTIDHAYGQQFRLARLYTRKLTHKEMYDNYRSIYGSDSPTIGFLEEWDANNVVNGILVATRNPENNGTLVGCVVSQPA